MRQGGRGPDWPPGKEESAGPEAVPETFASYKEARAFVRGQVKDLALITQFNWAFKKAQDAVKQERIAHTLNVFGKPNAYWPELARLRKLKKVVMKLKNGDLDFLKKELEKGPVSREFLSEIVGHVKNAAQFVDPKMTAYRLVPEHERRTEDDAFFFHGGPDNPLEPEEKTPEPAPVPASVWELWGDLDEKEPEKEEAETETDYGLIPEDELGSEGREDEQTDSDAYLRTLDVISRAYSDEEAKKAADEAESLWSERDDEGSYKEDELFLEILREPRWAREVAEENLCDHIESYLEEDTPSSQELETAIARFVLARHPGTLTEEETEEAYGQVKNFYENTRYMRLFGMSPSEQKKAKKNEERYENVKKYVRYAWYGVLASIAAGGAAFMHELTKEPPVERGALSRVSGETSAPRDPGSLPTLEARLPTKADVPPPVEEAQVYSAGTEPTEATALPSIKQEGRVYDAGADPNAER